MAQVLEGMSTMLRAATSLRWARGAFRCGHERRDARAS